MANIAKIELGDTTYDIKDAVVRPKIDAITAEDADGNTYVNTSQLTVDGNSNLGIATANAIAIKGPRDSNISAFTIKSENINRDTTETIAETQWGSKFRFTDNNDETIGYIEPFQRPSGSTGVRILGWNEKSDGEAVWNGFGVEVEKDGTLSYIVSNPAAFRAAIDAVSKTGDTMTGSLVIKNGALTTWGDNTGYAMMIRDGRFDIDGANPSSDQWSAVHGFSDKDGDNIGYLQAYELTNGTTGLNLFILNKNSNGSGYSNLFRLAVDKNGTKSYQVGDATAFRTAIGAVSKTGDTITGNIMRRDTVHNLKQANNGVTSTQWPGFGLQDKNGYTYSGFYGAVQNNGKTGTGMWVYNRNSAGTQVTQGSFEIHADKSGNISYSLSNPAALRTAIGAASTDADGAINTMASTENQQWYVRGKINNSSSSINGHYTWLVMYNWGISCWDATARKTLWTTYTEKNLPESSVGTLSYGNIYRYGKMRILKIDTNQTNYNLNSSWSNMVLGTLEAKDRPIINTDGLASMKNVGGNVTIGLQITTDGKVHLLGLGGTPAGNHPIWGQVVYLVA